MKNRVNAYDCPACGKPTVTIDADEGVTPMFVACRATVNCNSNFANSRMYENCNGLIPEWEWYKPAKGEIRSMESDMKRHIEMGGLCIRALTTPTPPQGGA